MHAYSYLRSAIAILGEYTGDAPLAGWLKNYFSKNKKFGSRDRKWIAHLCYCFFRTGKGFDGHSTEEKIIKGVFLTATDGNELLQGLDAELDRSASKNFEEKLEMLAGQDWKPLGDLESEISSDIDSEAFQRSYFVQPDLFIRVRPGKLSQVKEKLKAAKLTFREEERNCLVLPINSKLDQVVETDTEVVIQDRNSQRVLDLFSSRNTTTNSFTAWDCCAASGGKSILLHDEYPQVQLTISDIRENILHNLHKRFAKAGIRQYKSQVFDLSSPTFHFSEQFDLVICDAPCTGSGTWGRTPEQLYYFRKEVIERYAALQKAIALNAAVSVKKGGYFLYITCSVFARENEEVVAHICDHTKLTLAETAYLKGYTNKADTLYSALFRSE